MSPQPQPRSPPPAADNTPDITTTSTSTTGEPPSSNPITFAPILHTPRLTLTLYSPSSPLQTSHVLSCYNTPTAHQEMGDFHLRTPSELKSYLSTSVLLDSKDLSPSSPFFSPSPPSTSSKKSNDSPIYIIRLGPSITEPDDEKDTMIGFVALASVSHDGGISPRYKGKPHMGWMMSGEEHMGKGYATEAARGVRGYWFGKGDGKLGVALPVRATIRVGNRGSERVAEKLGMKRVKEEDGGVEVRDDGERRGEWVWEGDE